MKEDNNLHLWSKISEKSVESVCLLRILLILIKLCVVLSIHHHWGAVFLFKLNELCIKG